MIRRLLFIVVLAAAGMAPSVASAQTNTDAARLSRREQIRQCRALLKQSIHKIDAGTYDSALVLLQSALACDSANPDAFYHQARVYMRLADTAGALEALTLGTERAPRSSRLKMFLARLKLAAGEVSEVDALIREVLAIKPHEAEANYLRGLVLLHNGDTTRAVDVLEKALRESFTRRSL